MWLLVTAVNILLFVLLINETDAQCGQYHGGAYLDNPSLDTHEDATGDTGLEVVFRSNPISGCPCGIITKWQIFARKNGTVLLYAVNGNTVVGFTSVYVATQSRYNHFEIPLSAPMFIPVRDGYNFGFFTASQPMITYDTISGSNVYWNTGQTAQGVSGTVSNSGNRSNRKYAVAAFVEEAHPPMFVNAPYTTTLYTHQTNTVAYTAEILDIDGTDTLTVTNPSPTTGFTWDQATNQLTYSSRQTTGTYDVNLSLSDGCNPAETTTITVILINEPLSFTRLPASVQVQERTTGNSALFTIAPTDSAGDSPRCEKVSTSPNTNMFSVSDTAISVTNAIYDYDVAKYYDIIVRCRDDDNKWVHNNFQIDVVKNPPPSFNPGSGYLPASVSVERTSGVTIYTLSWTDDNSVTLARVDCAGLSTCPFSLDGGTGAISTNAALDSPYYDVSYTISDNLSTTGPYYLSILTSGRPDTFNEAPILANLPASKYVMEHTAVGATLFKVIYTDQNVADTFTFTAPAAAGLAFDTSTGIITVSTDRDFEMDGAGPVTMTVTINDGFVSVSEDFTVTLLNVNEGVTMMLATAVFSIAEGSTARGTEVGDPGVTVVEIDAGDTYYVTMDCGTDNKYFYFNPADEKVYMAQYYDMDTGASGSATCSLTVRDIKGFTDNGTITITVTEENDHAPKFPHRNYVFLADPTDTFFSVIENMVGSDDDINDSPDTLAYSFNPTSASNYFQIDAAGVLYVRNVSTFSTGSTYEFNLIVQDTSGWQGTCTVTIIFSGIKTTTTTTTERTMVFSDDYMNYWWMLLVGGVVLAMVVFIIIMVCKDPVMYDYLTYRWMQLNDWCRRKPKPRVPKRSVGKLTVKINAKTLENDPDNALPWELMAKDGDVPEINEVQEDIRDRMEARKRDSRGKAVFKKGVGVRPDSAASLESGRDSESPKYATFVDPDREPASDADEPEGAAGGIEGRWGESPQRRIVVTPVPQSEQENTEW